VEKQPEIAARKNEAKGPGLGLTIGIGVVLLGAWAGVRMLMVRNEPSPEWAPSDRRVIKPAPLPMPAPRPATTLTQESLGYARKEEDMVNPTPDVHVSPQDIPPTLNFSGVTGPYAKKAYVLKTQAEWDAFWRSTGASDIPPLSDAEDVIGRGASMAVAVCAGEQPAGTAVVIHMVELSGPRIMVSYKVVPPAKRTEGTVRPFQVVTIPRSNKAVSFNRTR